MEDEDEEYNNIMERILAGTMEPRHLPFQVLARITENFSQKRKIGEGGFGVVYKGVLQNKNTIAVKRIKMNSDTVDDDGIFLDELEKLLVHMQHQNVVRFLGYYYQSCHEGIKAIEPQKLSLSQTRERLLCFEYISNGSLDKHITDELRGLEWITRFQIIKGICQGLQYLHEEKEIIHMDLNPKNVMVDDYMVPKITDFGLAIRLAENAHNTGQLFGTRGYCAPDGNKSVKCDIYSLGVIIVELVTGLKGIIPVDKTNVLRRWKWSYKWNKSARQVPLQAEQVTKCIEIGERCMQEEPNNRPHSISEIISDLNKIENTSSGDIFAVDLIKTSDDDMLGIKPLELRFGYQINEQISEVEITLTNETSNCVAFNIEARYPLKCSKRKGIVQGSNGTCVVFITLEARKATALSSDKVIVQSTKVKEGLTDKDVSNHMFNHEAPNVVDEVNLTVVYDVPVSKDVNITSKDQRLNFHPPHKTLLKYKYRQASDNQAVDVETGVMGPLLPKDMKHLKYVPQDIEDDLSTVLQKKDDDFEPDNKWVRKVKELSYDTEDPVDGLLRVRTEGSEPATNQQELQKTIEDITERDNRLADMCPEQTAGDYVATPGARKGHIKLVGIDRTRDELLKRLLGGDDGVFTPKLRIMSIFGGGGLGKTTLARAVYDSLAATYILKAFVMVGRNREVIWVLEEILFRLNEVKYSDIHTKIWDERKLFEELRHVLEKKRYLIVIDDIWDKESWEIIMKAFRDHNCGSRVITTSRIYEVAEYSDEVCKLEPLPNHHSKELFYEGLSSRGKDICNLDETEEQCITEILKKCGGVPLAIITMASLLANKPKEDWPEVYKSIGLFGDEKNGDVDMTRKILKFSYDDLPRHLKTCLLLLSTFPEDREIERNTLVWQWVAEGFVPEEKGKTLFMVGESYFNQLIDRSLLQPIEGTSYTIHLCRVHHMVLDMICSVAKDENFVSTVLDSIDEQHPPCSESVVHRLCVRKGNMTQQDLDKSCIPKQVWSFNASGCCFLFDLMSLQPSFQFLRLLSMECCLLTGDHLLQSITGCHHLAYLGLSRTVIGELPMELGHLRYLQTLDLRGTALKALPQSVTMLTQLKCLRSEGTEMALPDGMGDLTSLEELRLDNVIKSPNFVKELGKLTNLRILHISTYMFGDSLNEALVESLSRLKKIEELELCDGGKCKAPTWHNFSPSRELRHLRLHNIRYSHGLPEWINPSFLPHLCHLNVNVKSAEAQDLVNLGNFQELASLCLFIDRYQMSTDAIAAGAYPKLQYYYMFFPRKFLPGAAPCLQTVEFRFHASDFRALKPNLDSLANLPLLMRVHVKIDCWDVTEHVAKAAEAAVRQAIRHHDKRPILVLERFGSCIDYVELKSNLDIENVILYKLMNRIRQFQREEGELDWDERDDPTDPEVISRELNFQVQAPSVLESMFDEMIDDGLPSMIQSVLNEMLAECRQREGGASSSRQAISRNSNSETPVASMIKSVIKKTKSIINAISEGGLGGAFNSEQLDSSDIQDCSEM